MKKLLLMLLSACISITASQQFTPKKLTLEDVANLPSYNVLAVLERATGVSTAVGNNAAKQAITRFEENLKNQLQNRIRTNTAQMSKDRSRREYYEILNSKYAKYITRVEAFAKRARYILSSPELIKSYRTQVNALVDSLQKEKASKRKVLEAMAQLNKRFTDIDTDWEFIEPDQEDEGFLIISK